MMQADGYLLMAAVVIITGLVSLVLPIGALIRILDRRRANAFKGREGTKGCK
jgi:hypothetical protein